MFNFQKTKGKTLSTFNVLVKNSWWLNFFLSPQEFLLLLFSCRGFPLIIGAWCLLRKMFNFTLTKREKIEPVAPRVNSLRRQFRTTRVGWHSRRRRLNRPGLPAAAAISGNLYGVKLAEAAAKSARTSGDGSGFTEATGCRPPFKCLLLVNLLPHLLHYILFIVMGSMYNSVYTFCLWHYFAIYTFCT